MTNAEIATTGMEQVRRSRNDIKPMCHCEERAIRALHVIARSVLSATGQSQTMRGASPAAKGTS